MGKLSKTLPHLGSEDRLPEDSNSNIQLYNLCDKGFREEMLRMFKKLEEKMEQTANKIQEYMRAERRKLQTEMTELKKTW